jgi:tetratricopeptide (TPR) repeat protein
VSAPAFFEDIMKFIALIVCAASCFAATPAEVAIKQAASNIEKQPAHYPYYNDLATAYARRARETADAQFYARADDALRKSFAIAPDNFEGRKATAFLQLERHEYARALESATKLNKTMPDDVAVYGYLVEANIELGNDQEAIAAAQWMLDLRPGNSGGLIHAAYLRELHGNLAGALELMQMAFEATPPSESSDRVWMLTQISHLQLLGGDSAAAERSAEKALQIFPTSHYALAALAQVRLAQHRYDDAASILRQRYEIAPHTENLYALGEAQELAGQHEEARLSFAKFETMARAEVDRADNCNHELVAYYVDHANAPEKALDVARRELARRHDIMTVDSYAWALAASGDYVEADRQLQAVLAIGSKDPVVLSHSRAVSLRLHETVK